MRYLIFLFLMLALPVHAERTAELSALASEAGVRVYYSFDHYARNSKMQRTFISGEMLKAADATRLWKSSAWDVSGVASRLTSLLSMHTHSVSTTQQVRKDEARVAANKAYEKYLHTSWDDITLMVYCHRGRGRTIEEMIIFKFRSNYCSRVIQLTGKLRPEDINAIIKQK